MIVAGANSRSSSRPSSGSRRRRRPNKSAPADNAPRGKARRRRSSDEHRTSDDNGSIFSDDSLTQRGARLDGGTPQSSATASQISDLRSSIQQLTDSIRHGDQPTVEGHEPLVTARDVSPNMAEPDAKVPRLVTYFETQISRHDDDKRQEGSVGRGRGRGRGRGFSDSDDQRGVRESSVTSAYSDEGSTSATEGTQTEGVSVVMGKAPVSILSAGVPGPDHSHFHNVCGKQNVHESLSTRAGSHRSWRLSITPTDAWDSNGVTDNDHVTDEVDSSARRRKSRTELDASPEKRQRQDHLDGLHAKYGLHDDLDETDVENLGPEGAARTHRQAAASTTYGEGRVRFEVLVSQDETNVLYNVAKTEYRTYSLNDAQHAALQAASISPTSTTTPIPDTININLTETTTLQRDDRFQTVTKERVIFDSNGGASGEEGDVLEMKRTFSGSHVVDFEQDREDGHVSRESSVERHLTDEDSSASLRLRSSGDELASGDKRTGKTKSLNARSTSSSGSVSPASSRNDKQRSSSPRPPRRATDSVHTKYTGQPVPTSTWSPDHRYSDSSSPGLRSPGYHGDHAYDSDVPADSGITETSTSESMTSHDEDGGDSATSPPASTPPMTSPAARVTAWREDVTSSYSYRKNGAGMVASQLQQTASMHQDPPAQHQAGVAASHVSAHGHATPHLDKATARLPSHLQVDQTLPDTPPPKPNQLPEDLLRVNDAANAVSDAACSPSPSPRVLPDGSVEIPVIVQTSQQPREDQQSEWSVSGPGVQYNPDGSLVRFIPADSWLAETGATQSLGHRDSSKQSAVTASEQKSGLNLDWPQSNTSSLTDSGVFTQSTDRDSSSSAVVSNTGRPSSSGVDKHRPSVGEISLEHAEPLPPPVVHRGSDSSLTFPERRDGVLLYSSSESRDEPYAWVDTYRHQTGVDAPTTQPAELAAEALLTEVKRRASKTPSEDEVFFEETVTIGGSMMTDGHTTISTDDSFRSVESQPLSVSGQRNLASTPLPQTALTSTPTLTPSIDSANGRPRPSHTPNSSRLSTEDSFHSADISTHSVSSESSVYRTPQQSPRNDDVFMTSPLPASMEIPSPRPSLSPTWVGEVGEGRASVLTAVAAAVGKQLVGTPTEVEAMRQVLKQEVSDRLSSKISFYVLSL